MIGRTPSNLLALAVLSLLAEGPTHPYELDYLMRARGLTEAIKLRRSSLYTVIAGLERDGLIVPVETQREGKRPERTIYAITDAGRAKYRGWHRELLRTPAREYPQFVAGLTFLAHVPPEEAIALLEERAGRLERLIDDFRVRLTAARERMGVHRLFLIEGEYVIAMHEAELAWVRGVIREIGEGTLAWPTFILAAQETLASEARDTSDTEGGGTDE